MEGLGLGAYRGDQIFKWLWQKGVTDFSSMTDIAKTWREKLSQRFSIEGLSLVKRVVAQDKSQKFLFQTADDEYLESVFIPELRRQTVCVSSQIGCPLGCRFCATALIPFRRNLAGYEIAEQIQIIKRYAETKVTNVVYMGMGEPLLNLKGLFESLEIICSSFGLGIGQRHITVSTAGIIDGITALLNSPFKVKLAISLNFVDEDMRAEMMPVTRKNRLKELLKLARRYSYEKHWVTFEYVLIQGINDSLKDARRLLRLIRDIPSKINLIPYNPHPRLQFKPPAQKQITQFYQYLLSSPHTVVLRKSRGKEILAGCGQLALDLTGAKNLL